MRRSAAEQRGAVRGFLKSCGTRAEGTADRTKDVIESAGEWISWIHSLVRIAIDAGALPSYAMPERVTFVHSLERTSVGKINKRALRERYG